MPAVVLTSRPREDWAYQAGEAVMTIKSTAVMHLGSMELIRDAVLAGAGADLLPENIAKPEISSGRLESWGRLLGRAVEVWMLYPSRRHPGAKVDVMAKLLAEASAG